MSIKRNRRALKVGVTLFLVLGVGLVIFITHSFFVRSQSELVTIHREHTDCGFGMDSERQKIEPQTALSRFLYSAYLVITDAESDES
ncbi:hypothetical protein AB4259_06380 [Vibrio amylolyticus]|uniref:hypothetical protein n=1 Tax=Vibrio amylolyticus TaxID=2847292 RepID=UPI0035509B20